MSDKEFKKANTASSGSLELPFLILTKDLIIRPLINEDRSAVQASIKESLANLKMWLPWTDEIPSIEESVKISNKYFEQAESGEAYHYAVYQNEKFMGMCSYIEHDAVSKTAHLSYWCRSNAGNENYFIDAVNAVISYAFKELGLIGLSISCIVGNFLSEEVAKVLNFKLQGIHIVRSKQIKLFKITNTTQLPELEVNWVKDDFARSQETQKKPAANDSVSYLESGF